MTCVFSLEASYDWCLVLGGSLWIVSCPWSLSMTYVLLLEAFYTCVFSLVAPYTLTLHFRGTFYALSR
jgi:hypothetical protein